MFITVNSLVSVTGQPPLGVVLPTTTRCMMNVHDIFSVMDLSQFPPEIRFELCECPEAQCLIFSSTAGVENPNPVTDSYESIDTAIKKALGE